MYLVSTLKILMIYFTSPSLYYTQKLQELHELHGSLVIVFHSLPPVVFLLPLPFFRHLSSPLASLPSVPPPSPCPLLKEFVNSLHMQVITGSQMRNISITDLVPHSLTSQDPYYVPSHLNHGTHRNVFQTFFSSFKMFQVLMLVVNTFHTLDAIFYLISLTPHSLMSQVRTSIPLLYAFWTCFLCFFFLLQNKFLSKEKRFY